MTMPHQITDLEPLEVSVSAPRPHLGIADFTSIGGSLIEDGGLTLADVQALGAEVTQISASSITTFLPRLLERLRKAHAGQLRELDMAIRAMPTLATHHSSLMSRMLIGNPQDYVNRNEVLRLIQQSASTTRRA